MLVILRWGKDPESPLFCFVLLKTNDQRTKIAATICLVCSDFSTEVGFLFVRLILYTTVYCMLWLQGLMAIVLLCVWVSGRSILNIWFCCTIMLSPLSVYPLVSTVTQFDYHYFATAAGYSSHIYCKYSDLFFLFHYYLFYSYPFLTMFIIFQNQ